MECELVKLDNLSNNETSIYSLFIENENKTLFDMFIEENVINHKAEVEDIIKRLHNIGKIGARIHFSNPSHRHRACYRCEHHAPAGAVTSAKRLNLGPR